MVCRFPQHAELNAILYSGSTAWFSVSLDTAGLLISVQKQQRLLVTVMIQQRLLVCLLRYSGVAAGPFHICN